LLGLLEVTFFTQNGCPFFERALLSHYQIHGGDKASAFAKTLAGAFGVFGIGF
jgi:hypothetical protein